MSDGAQSEDRDPRICHCWKVHASDIRRAVSRGCRTVEALGEKLGAGTGCGNCFGDLERELDGARRRWKLEKDGQYLLPISRSGM